MLQASVVMPILNGGKLMSPFLLQHNLYEFKTSYNLVIVNNGSTDNTQEVLERWQSKKTLPMEIIKSETNLGFGGGNNLGANSFDSEVIIFTQNDVEIKGDYITPLYEAAMKDKDALHGPTLYSHNTGWNKFGNYVVPYLEGWCLACYRKTWNEMGGWDAETYYPIDFEDVDISYAFIKSGKRLNVVRVPLKHIGGGTTGYSEARMVRTRKLGLKFAEKWGLDRPEWAG